MRKVWYSVSLSAAMLASSALPVWAQSNIINLQPGFWNTLETMTIPGLVAAAIKLILIVAALIFFFLLIIGGIQWMTSGGDKAATEAARGRITAALIGLVIVFAAWAIGSLINYFFNVNIFNLQIPQI